MTQKRCIVVHGCTTSSKDTTYNKHWIPWLKKNLTEHGFEVDTPDMPLPWEPDYEKFKGAFEACAVDEDTTLVGDSCGCAFLVRWLGESKQKIDKLILVAPWKIAYRQDGSDKDFYGFEIDPSITERVNELVFFTADDEEDDGKKSLEIYKSVLDGKVVDLPGRGHYVLGDMGTEEFPELLDFILN